MKSGFSIYLARVSTAVLISGANHRVVDVPFGAVPVRLVAHWEVDQRQSDLLQRVRTAALPCTKLADYTAWVKKRDTKLMPITSPNIYRFSKSIHRQTQW